MIKISDFPVTNDHPIWRPNGIPQDAWEAMPRDEQLSHWEQESDDEPARQLSLLRLLPIYEKYGFNLFFELICRDAYADDLDEFIATCSENLIEQIRESLKVYGDDESKWPRTWFGDSYAPWVSAEAIEEARSVQQQQHWDGIRVLKSKLG